MSKINEENRTSRAPSDMLRRMKRSADDVWNTEKPFDEALRDAVLSTEQLIGIVCVFEEILKAGIAWKFDAFSPDQLSAISEMSASLCVDLSALGGLANKWHFIHGHIMAELSRRNDE